MKKLSSNSIANVIAIISLVIATISLNRSCQSIEFANDAEVHARKSECVSAVMLTWLESEQLLEEFESYKKSSNDEREETLILLEVMNELAINTRKQKEQLKSIIGLNKSELLSKISEITIWNQTSKIEIESVRATLDRKLKKGAEPDGSGQ
jgi:hypothetical protein